MLKLQGFISLLAFRNMGYLILKACANVIYEFILYTQVCMQPLTDVKATTSL